MFLCTGSSPARGSTGLYGEMRETRVYISPQVPGLPQRAESIACLLFSHTEYSLTFTFGFKNKYLNILFLISTPNHLFLIKLVHEDEYGVSGCVNPGIPFYGPCSSTRI